MKVEPPNGESENQFIPQLNSITTVKTEAEVAGDVLDTTTVDDISEVKASDFLFRMKQERSEDVCKNELLHEECDLPGIKSDNDFSEDSDQSCSTEQTQEVLETTNKGIAGKRKKKQSCPTCGKVFRMVSGRMSAFGVCLGADLRKLPERQQTIAQKLIADVIFSAKMGWLKKTSRIFHSPPCMTP